MAGYRFCLSLILGLTLVHAAQSQNYPYPLENVAQTPSKSTKPADASTPMTKVYSLSDLGDDPNLCKWIAETIPQMIQPGSWGDGEAKKSLSYYGPGKVLVICHTPAVHAQVEEFIQGLKKALPARGAHTSQVMPAQFQAPDGPRVGPVVSAAQAYPIPYPPQSPKHLFHFIIRYEGEGIVDSNVVKFAQALKEAEKSSTSQSFRIPSVPGASFNAPSTPSNIDVRKMPPADPLPSPPASPSFGPATYSVPPPPLPTGLPTPNPSASGAPLSPQAPVVVK